MRSRKAVVASATGMVMALALSGCGGVEPKAWASDVCGSVKSMDATMRKQSKRLVLDMSKPAATQKSLVSMLGTLSDQTDQLAADVDEAGTPDVENGGEVSDRYVARLKKASAVFAKAETELKAADSKDPAALMKTVQKVGTDLQTHAQRVGDPSGTVGSPQLRKALKADPACRKVAS